MILTFKLLNGPALHSCSRTQKREHMYSTLLVTLCRLAVIHDLFGEVLTYAQACSQTKGAAIHTLLYQSSNNFAVTTTRLCFGYIFVVEVKTRHKEIRMLEHPSGPIGDAQYRPCT